jgi:hypothetical protein
MAPERRTTDATVECGLQFHYRQIRLIPMAVASCARVTIAGVEVPRGEASPAIMLDAQDAGAETKLRIVVTAEDGLRATVRVPRSAPVTSRWGWCA